MQPPDSDEAHTRHYPLDLPSLPFDRYEHRRITARDVLVNRIMAALMAPATPELATAFRDQRSMVSKGAPIKHSLNKSDAKYYMQPRAKHHNFGPIKQLDPDLARDVELLRKMLVTRGEHEWIREVAIKPVRRGAHRNPPYTNHFLQSDHSENSVSPSGGLTVEEEILDLVRRHYLEMDDPATRLWLQTIRPAQRSAYSNVSNDTGKKGTYRLAVQERQRRDNQNAEDDDKQWYYEDAERLKSLQSHARVAGETRLYEGGAVLPSLRRTLLRSKEKRVKFLNDTMQLRHMQSFFSEDTMGQDAICEVYPWPEGEVPRRLFHIPSYHSWRQRHDFFYLQRPVLDFASGRRGRGLDRDGIWSTSRWEGDDLPRGRRVQKDRRRAGSEPPPGLFTAARLPVDFNSCRELLVFPKMNVSTIDRRSRRRSLSRTRIAEMFNWDTVLESVPREMSFHEHMTGMVPKTDFDLRQEEQRQEQDILYKDLAKAFDVGEISIEEVKMAAWDRAPEWESRRPHEWPRWWREIDGLSELSFTRGMLMGHVFQKWIGLGRHLEPRPMRQRYAPRQQDDWPLWACSYVRVLQAKHPVFSRPGPSLDSDKAPSICANCASGVHPTTWCSSPCGYCGAPTPHTVKDHVVSRDNRGPVPRPGSDTEDEDDDTTKANRHHNPHFSPDCPVARQNRCRCGPFPQYHVAAKCPVLCSRDCGNHTHPPGHFKHKNAMGCKSRCCMCGLKGHNGIQCKLRRCRCGGQHLGQDCCFHPECRVKDCDRFLCGMHCQSCGLVRSELPEGSVFVRRRCPTCAEKEADIEGHEPTAEEPVASEDEEFHDAVESQPLLTLRARHTMPTAKPAQATTTNGRARRKNKRKHRPDDAKSKSQPKPWYAPLAPRTRPVVGSKSGKDKWAWKADAEAAERIGGCR